MRLTRLGPSKLAPLERAGQPSGRPRPSARERGYTTEWDRARLDHLRDEPLCRMCSAEGRVVGADEVDHIVPHMGDMALFWDRSNWQSLCRSHHLEKSRAEAQGKSAAAYPDWLPRPVVPVTVVCGPPASGKSTYVAERAGPDDAVIDLDVIASRLAGSRLHDWDRRWLVPALRARNEAIAALGEAECRWPAGWLIVTAPEARRRQWWADRQAGDVVMLCTVAAECVDRIRQDPGRQARRDGQEAAVFDWHDRYTPRAGDAVW